MAKKVKPRPEDIFDDFYHSSFKLIDAFHDKYPGFPTIYYLKVWAKIAGGFSRSIQERHPEKLDSFEDDSTRVFIECIEKLTSLDKKHQEYDDAAKRLASKN